ncbi:glutamate-5-semialdehyde dehydrogenase [Brackiella oedipodis]|uniref:glutamate-5-semialdehyde dehydrogenase n=1 Tax=Brackiella oedipodis TaxID=124225 RepID=UPI000685AC8E|nr:glutamate-5-semialdehyde dehydrogenase [Brackiella oedipodis]
MTQLDINAYMQDLGRQAKQAAQELLKISGAQKNQALNCLADFIEQEQAALLAANQEDLQAARAKQLAAPLVDRLKITEKSIALMTHGLRQIANMDEPIGTLSASKIRPNGMKVAQMRVPLGVIGIIYESRPNVTIDAAALCLKTSNACILRGGKEAFASNQLLGQLIQKVLQTCDIPAHAVQVLNTTDRQAVDALITLTEFVDVIIPRGGKSLLQRLSERARVPMIMHLEGNCHMYIDAEADPAMAIKLAHHAKTYRYGICGALETLLVHQQQAKQVLPTLAQLFETAGVKVHACKRSIGFFKNAQAATTDDWLTEYLAPEIAIRIVDSLEEAITHINRYSSGHTESIISNNLQNAEKFQRWVDSSSVLVNLPTVFADGFEYGLGAEIGISTNRLHARGPVGLEGLTTYKWVLSGNGQTRH